MSETVESVLYKTERLLVENDQQRQLQYDLRYEKFSDGNVITDRMFPDETYSMAGLEITMKRSVLTPVMNTFLPSLLIVFTSFIR